MRYTIKSIKGTVEIDGTAADAVRAAIEHDNEYQPAYGTTIEIARNEIAGWEVLALDSADEAIEELMSEASDRNDWRQVAMCKEALEADHGDPLHRTLVAVLAQIVETHVEAVQS